MKDKKHSPLSLKWLLQPYLIFTCASLLISCSTTNTTTQAQSPARKDTLISPDKLQVVVLNTRLGRIVIELNDKRTPLHARNFRHLVTEGLINGTTFHRVIPGFIIQGGDPNSLDQDRANDGFGGPGYTIPYEGGLSARRGSVVMARLPDAQNPSRESNGSQFYILLRDAPEITGVDTVFGRVLQGMEVVERIAALPADERDNPIDRVTITASVMSYEKARAISKPSTAPH